MIERFAFAVLGAATLLVTYAYVLYPALLMLVRRGPEPVVPGWTSADDWPLITILIAAYNEERQIRQTIESLLALKYPAHLKHILVVSDASSDGTDDIVREYAHRGVELLRVTQRGGKTIAENAAADHLRGDIVVNTDASIRIRPDALEPMIAAFADPSVGVVSGTDVSVSSMSDDANRGEGAYVDYEMWLRGLETQAGGIVGASGCFFAIRADLQRIPALPHLSRDFAAALVAREHGLRALSMPASICYVPRSADVRAEYRRKVRTFTRGMETLHHKKHLLNPVTHGVFAWKLFSHKLVRWMIPWAALFSWLAMGWLALSYVPAALAFAVGSLGIVVGVTGWRTARPDTRHPRWLSIPTYIVVGFAAVIHATLRAARGERAPMWEPTRRPLVELPEPARAGSPSAAAS